MITIVFFILFLLVGILALVLKTTDKDIAEWKKPVGFGLIFLAFIVLIIGSFTVIDAGEVGVISIFGNVEKTPIKSGFHFVNPMSKITKMSTRTQAYTMSSRSNEGTVQGNDAIVITMKDQSSPQLDITVKYHLSESEAPRVYSTIGIDYVEKIIRPDIKSVLPRVATLFNSTDLYINSQRTQFESLCRIQLDSVFRVRGVILEDVNLREVFPSKAVQDAINQKIVSQQESQAMEYKMTKAQQEARIQIIEAMGIDSSQRIIAHSLTSSYLQWKYIDALKTISANGNMTIFSPFDQHLAPILNLQEKQVK